MNIARLIFDRLYKVFKIYQAFKTWTDAGFYPIDFQWREKVFASNQTCKDM